MHADESNNCLTNQWLTHTHIHGHTYNGAIVINSNTAEFNKKKIEGLFLLPIKKKQGYQIESIGHSDPNFYKAISRWVPLKPDFLGA